MYATPDSSLFTELMEEATGRMSDAYQNIPAHFWVGRNAFSHRFDNLRQMATRSAAANPVEAKAPLAVSEELLSAKRTALYLGVPWCIQSCSFCDLAYSRSPRAEEKREYIEVILQELDLYNDIGLSKVPAGSLYFGGGTPSILDNELLASFVDGTLQRTNLAGNAVITLEGSPATLTDSKLKILSSRVNRISLGVQSTDTELRQREGRILPRDKLLDRISATLDHVELVNTDVLYGMPGQSPESVYCTLVDLVRLNVPSITFYRNELFPGTKSYRLAQQEPWSSIEEFNARKMYFLGKVYLESCGYSETPLGWFVKSKQTMAISSWEKMIDSWSSVVPYFGLGMGAFSTAAAHWIQNSESLKDWMESIRSGRLPLASGTLFNEQERFMVKFMRYIRVFSRVKREFLLSQSGSNRSAVESLIGFWKKAGLAIDEAEWLVFTQAGESLIHWLIDDLTQAFVNGVLRSEKNILAVNI
ncbi:radical SAM protein [Pseudomonas sp. KFB-139]|uniref:Radical SAM protein n=1 Tax=Pseudomonas serbiensis TaxID=3064350 RepID=A0ABT9CMX9_9PSED|nr:radical SAM protein [Pseudomonas sp. KFB-138]MDO7926850.1 radical SAM protein [Pseudomonas sp. KFB-138]